MFGRSLAIPEFASIRHVWTKRMDSHPLQSYKAEA
jgi:hypothetical protein